MVRDAVRLITSRSRRDAIAELKRPVRFIHASSIAVFGTSHKSQICDDTVPRPSMVYGKHKRMAELAVEDAASRGIDAVSLRLSGIVARPSGGARFKSAFMSDIFAAIAAGEAYDLPVGPEATLWLMAATTCADNLLYAIHCAFGARRVLTLPALRTRVKDLVVAIASMSGGSMENISYRPDPKIEDQFGSLPPLSTTLAENLGFRRDRDLAALVRSALSSQERDAIA